MKRVILCPNPYRDKGLAAAKEADAILRRMGMVGNHQQQSLRSCICSSQSAGCQRSVNCTCCTCF